MGFNKLKNIKLVIFDLDGTLINAYPAIYESFNFVMRKFHLKTQKNLVIKRAVGTGDRNLLKPFVGQVDVEKVLSEYRKHHKTSLVQKSRLFPKVEELLVYLKNKGLKLAVASNRPTRFSKILIKHLGINKYFDMVLCGDKVKNMKPHPEILNNIMGKFKIKPIDTVYVGDMVIDLLAGKRAKVNVIAVNTGSSTKKELLAQKPQILLEKVYLLKKFV